MAHIRLAVTLLSSTMRSTLILLICTCEIQLASSFPEEALIGVVPAIPDGSFIAVNPPTTDHLIGVRNLDVSSGEFVGILPGSEAKSKVRGGGIQIRRGPRKLTKAEEFCFGNKEYYRSYCIGMLADRDESQRNFLFRFCPWYENRCLHRR
ncbi:hypothetical protein V3C99_002760 [Haemonchus contortus]